MCEHECPKSHAVAWVGRQKKSFREIRRWKVMLGISLLTEIDLQQG